MWYQSKVSYRLQDNFGKWKSYTEQYLHDAVSFSDVETQIYSVLEGRLTDFEIKGISLVKFEGVYEPHVGGDFYKVTILTEDTIEDKKSNSAHLVAAADVVDAERRTEKYMSGWLSNNTIIAVVKSPILGVWHPFSEDWQNDFKSRQADLADSGRESADVNQMNIPFGEPVEA
ncbi:hypothetical protein GGR92_000014 [Spirosoma lacussanchae]|uniref:DUF4494 family protein n=1 Tax=Spirosoma lacussanchae TaxID=1884249 RepID=UPI001109E20B|nr:DUF4494 family protein [Spirosoma lacussanchae]